ncbi:sigma-54 dependent transcriptional regulator [bacterium]|nr:sigma-54 dependent transcriptional regulator [bacterium]
MREELSETFDIEGYTVWVAPDCATARSKLAQNHPDAILLDLQLPDGDGMEMLPWILQEHPGIPVVIGTSHATYEKAVKAIRLGAYDFIEKTGDREQLTTPIRNAVEKRRLERVQAALRRELRGDVYLVAESKAMRDLLTQIDKVAPTDEKILLMGESGTGKGIIADYIQSQSKRAGAPYIKLNCAGIPPTLIESELFGYEQGAHATAFQRKDGLFHAADGGTLLLDEIGDMSLGTQSNLLQVLQEGTVRRLGQNTAAKVDVRVLAATNQNLSMMVKEKQFRADLLERLQVFAFTIPPLRERPEDLLHILELELQSAAKLFGKQPLKLAPDAKALLLTLEWRGNARSVQSFAKRLTAYADGQTIAASDIKRFLEQPEAEPVTYKLAKGAWEREWLIRLLLATGGNRSKAAQVADIDPKTLYTKLRDHGLEEFSPD